MWEDRYFRTPRRRFMSDVLLAVVIVVALVVAIWFVFWRTP